jgi:uncharacterized protein with FMN-binding domain
MTAKKNSPTLHWFAVATIVFVMICAFLIHRHRSQFTEAAKLPFTPVNLEEVADGVYTGKTYTSFLHLQLEVTVKDHRLVAIDVIENDGIDGETARPILQKMLEENKIVVPAVKGAEIGSLVYISCVSTALSQENNAED